MILNKYSEPVHEAFLLLDPYGPIEFTANCHMGEFWIRFISTMPPQPLRDVSPSIVLAKSKEIPC
jgi:hypothetical protein